MAKKSKKSKGRKYSKKNKPSKRTKDAEIIIKPINSAARRMMNPSSTNSVSSIEQRYLKAGQKRYLELYKKYLKTGDLDEAKSLAIRQGLWNSDDLGAYVQSLYKNSYRSQ